MLTVRNCFHITLKRQYSTLCMTRRSCDIPHSYDRQCVVVCVCFRQCVCYLPGRVLRGQCVYVCREVPSLSFIPHKERVCVTVCARGILSVPVCSRGAGQAPYDSIPVQYNDAYFCPNRRSSFVCARASTSTDQLTHFIAAVYLRGFPTSQDFLSAVFRFRQFAGCVPR